MKLIHSPEQLAKLPAQPVCLAIGFFDGVHLGHQRIIAQTISDSRQCRGLSVVITFDRHPNAIVAPSRVPPLIYSFGQKARMISQLGADALYAIHFDEQFSRQTGEEFIGSLCNSFSPVNSLCVGTNFFFGHKRSGDISLLRKLAETSGFTVHGIEPVTFGGQPVSSTRIRETISSGDLETASALLGRPYSLTGTVIEGAKLGRTLGFPTANLDTNGLILPPNGVYAIRAMASSNNSTETLEKTGVLNIGIRPTIHGATGQRTVEAHLLDFEADLYGKELEITFVTHLRDEQRFSSKADLQQQIKKDIEAARRLFLSTR